MRSRERLVTSGLRMTAETLRAEVVAALLELAWEQWSQLGVSAAPPEDREKRATDPEALLLFTLAIGRTDPRLFDEVLDWLALNAQLVSVHRLRNLCANPTDRALVDSALDWVAGARRRERPAGAAHRRSASTDVLEPLFPSLSRPRGDLDPAFSSHGLARARLTASGKSQRPSLHDPINFAFRLRRLLGVGVRAEVMRTLLTIRAPRFSGKVITASAGFAQRNVREGLTQLHEAGVIDMVQVADDRHYSARTSHWATLLGLPTDRDLPQHYDWIPAYRALTQILRWLQQPGLDELSPYLRASSARTLVTDIEYDLRWVRVPPDVYTARGADFWDDFIEITRATIHNARGSS
jgi:hypothetical protein